MVDVAIRITLPAVRIRVEIPHHVFMNSLLEIDSDFPVAANYFIGADASVCRNVPAWVRNTNVVGYVSHRVVGALDRSRRQFAQELLVYAGYRRPGLRSCGEKCGDEIRRNIRKDSAIDSSHICSRQNPRG